MKATLKTTKEYTIELTLSAEELKFLWQLTNLPDSTITNAGVTALKIGRHNVWSVFNDLCDVAGVETE